MYREYVQNMRARDVAARAPLDAEGATRDDQAEVRTTSGFSLGRTVTSTAMEGMPDSLTRVQSRHMEAKLERKRTNISNSFPRYGDL